MDGKQFDLLARTMATATSRRGALKTALGGVILGAIGLQRPGQILASPGDEYCSHRSANQSHDTLLYFALGDSVASGHGLADGGPPCRQSLEAYPYQLAKQLRGSRPDLTIEFGPSHHFACSGSRSGDEGPDDLNSQVNNVIIAAGSDSDRPILVTITSGINDIWGDELKLLELLGRILAMPGDTFGDWLDEITSPIEKNIRASIDRLLEIGPNTAVLVAEYFNPMNPDSLFFIPFRLACMLQDCYGRTEDIIASLNRALARAVESASSNRVGLAGTIDESFAGHASNCGLDQQPDSWIQNSLDPSTNSGIPFDCFHPNFAGAQAIAGASASAALALIDRIAPRP